MQFDERKMQYNKNIVSDIVEGRKRYICFGAGSYFQGFIKKYCYGKEIFPLPEMVVDNNSNKWGTKIEGVEVKSPDALKDIDIDNTVIALSTNLPLGILNDAFEKYQRHYHMVILLKQIDAYFFVQQNEDKLDQVYNLFEDDFSKMAYKEYFETLLSGSFLCPMIYSPNAYWNNDLIPELENTGVVYAGAFDGKHVDRALNANENCEMYAFEPNQIMYTRLIEKYKERKNVHIYPYALFDEQCKLKFNPAYALGAMIVRDEMAESNVDKLDIVEANTMDHVLKDKKIGLIALDVEGTELCALKGAAEIIKRNRPKLGICVYHKLEDYFEIPLYIKENYPDYKIHFRHHSSAIIESVLYAI